MYLCGAAQGRVGGLCGSGFGRMESILRKCKAREARCKLPAQLHDWWVGMYKIEKTMTVGGRNKLVHLHRKKATQHCSSGNNLRGSVVAAFGIAIACRRGNSNR